MVSVAAASRACSRPNANLLATGPQGKVESFTVKSSADGRAIQAWKLVTPPDFEAVEKASASAGNPRRPRLFAYGPHFAPETQPYAAAGYVVLLHEPARQHGYQTGFQDLIQDAIQDRTTTT